MLFIQSLALFASLAAATDFQAWNDGQCNGSAGDRVTVFAYGSCINVEGRHSWEATGDDVRGYYFTGTGCQGQSTRFDGKKGVCKNINTGGAVRSMCVVGKSNSVSPEQE